MADQFCLRWNNFQTNIVTALDSLKCSEDLVDVTLTCEGKNIKAHKVILSACSPYFRNVFKENPCQHPVIILKDVQADDIVSLLSYMYQGEVFIEESKLSSFLHTAALLQVKGLTGVTQQGSNAQGDEAPVVVKMECPDEEDSLGQPAPLDNPDIESDNLPTYENSMLARSLLSGINPCKSDINANNSSPKSKLNKNELNANRKDTNSSHNLNVLNKSPLKILNDEPSVKSEKQSPKSDLEYEPEVLPSEQQDGIDSEGAYNQESSQALLLLAGMSSVPVLATGASTSQGTSHQSNHAAICGDCPHCGMKYSNQSALKYHVRLMHSDLTNRLCCYLCPRSFTMRETFKEHMWTSHGQRN
ncbi:Broad-complex core protein isoform 6 [Eumeta japonica]|uniref:Broad-complex core protein isoform 6 n=1 Tax=Eumeta variegata TaxID=151549 RepID=A0A4C1TJA2_EUMVA|nr:Broad-complex core protein isoform 6 [Eumeta japonica]